MTLRIAHLSDIHFGGEDVGAVEAAPAAVAAFRPQLTVVTGDLTAVGASSEFARAAAWVGRLPEPRLVTPGNHDTPYWNPFLRLATPFERYRRCFGADRASAYDGPGLAARALNSARGVQLRLNWSKGALSPEAVRALDWPADERIVRLFACHHPLVDPAGAPVTGEVRGGPAAVSILARQGVELMLSGHLHNPFAVRLGERLPASYALGAGTLSTRTRGVPASFSTIAVEDDVVEVTVQLWREGRFQPGPARRLPRQRA